MGLDPRIGSKFLHPDPGFGGSCFPKDTQALLKMAANQGLEMRIVKAAIDINQAQAGRIIEKLRTGLRILRNQQTAVLGLAFKSNTDDIRQSPALRVCELLLAEGAQIRAHDPVANNKAARMLENNGISYRAPMRQPMALPPWWY